MAANDIHMDPVGQTRVPNNGRPRTAATAATAAATREYDDGVFDEDSTETLATRSKAVIVVPSTAVELGDFIQGFWMMMNLLLRCHRNIGMNLIVRVL